MKNTILKTTMALALSTVLFTGCVEEAVNDLTDGSIGGGSSSKNDKLTFSGNTENFTVTWDKKYNQYGEVKAGRKAMASANGAEKISIVCTLSSPGQKLSYSCKRSNLRGSYAITSFSLSEGDSVDWRVDYKETSVGSGYGTTEGSTKFTLVNNNGTLSKN